MILYGSSLSPYVRKTMAFLNEKGLDFSLEPTRLGGGQPEFDETSPFRKMPGFRDPGADNGRDFTISDSTAIITYIDSKYPEPNLIPTDPIGRARTVWYEEFADTILTVTGGKMFFNRVVAPKFLQREGDLAAADAAETVELPPLIDYLEGVIPGSGFLVEDRLTLADLAVASVFVNIAHCCPPLDSARWPRTCTYVAAILARPSYAPIVEAENRMVAAMG